MRADLPGPGLGSADPPGSAWAADVPAVPVIVVPADWIPAVPDGVVGVFAGSGALVAVVTVKPGVWPELTGRGALSAATIAKAQVLAHLTGSGALSATAGFAARLAGSGTLTAVASHPARFGGSGQLSAAVTAHVQAAPAFTGSGTLTAPTRIALPAALAGSGELSAVVIGGYPAAAAFAGSGALAAVIVPKAQAAAALTGSGELTAQLATFTAAAALTGSGTLSATAQAGFQPSGMNKNGNSAQLSTSYTEVTSWTADTTGYPGSTVSSNALVANGSKAAAIVSASVIVANSQFGTVWCRLALYRNGVLLHEGSETTVPAAGTATVTVNVTSPVTTSITSGDLITLQARAQMVSSITVQGGTSSWVHIT
ncbi:hypothetical protein [Nocardia sp. NPDC050793]|uniref:hypothetical protein n=1 Tax=Nocardia sp. NPDC050793 TaxID=3155159 RepID=UPI0033E9E3A7